MQASQVTAEIFGGIEDGRRMVVSGDPRELEVVVRPSLSLSDFIAEPDPTRTYQFATQRYRRIAIKDDGTRVYQAV